MTPYASIINYHTFSYPVLPDDGASMEEFIPSGWSVLAVDSGDLDKDMTIDIALVLEYNDSIRVDDNVLAQPRVFAILFRNNKNGYDLALQSDSLIPMNDQWNMEDPFNENCLSIKKGVLELNFSVFHTAGSWCTTGYSYKFRYQNGEFLLIGADFSTFWRNGANPSAEYSYNFITGKKLTIISPADDDENGGTEKKWSTITGNRRVTLSTFGDPFSWNFEGETH